MPFTSVGAGTQTDSTDRKLTIIEQLLLTSLCHSFCMTESSQPLIKVGKSPHFRVEDIEAQKA